MRAGRRFPILGDDEVGQHVNLTNIPVPQESKRDTISVLVNDGMGSDTHTRKEEK